MPCRWCGEEHSTVCPRVSAIEFDESDRVTRVEFFPPVARQADQPTADYPKLEPAKDP